MAARDLKKESFWRRMVQAQAGSGMSVRSWCRRRRVQEVTFYWWRRELARREAEACVDRDAGRPVSFVPVHISADPPVEQGGRIEVVLAGGRRIRISGRVDRQTLSDVLAALEAPPC